MILVRDILKIHGQEVRPKPISRPPSGGFLLPIPGFLLLNSVAMPLL
jgi:hypothetical protein